MNNRVLKFIGRRKAGAWGRPRKQLKRIAHKATRRFNKMLCRSN